MFFLLQLQFGRISLEFFMREAECHFKLKRIPSETA